MQGPEIPNSGYRPSTDHRKLHPLNYQYTVAGQQKNIEALQLSALKISQKQLKQLNELYRHPEQLEFLRKLSAAKTWEATLKNERDYQQHGIEVLLPALENGQYVIMATPLAKDGKNAENKTFAFSPVQVTNMALVATQTSDAYNFQVVDRQDGHPISGVELQFTYRKNGNTLD